MSDYESTDVLSRIMERQARLEEQIKGALRRIDEQKQLVESVHALALSIEKLTSAQNLQKIQIEGLSKDVKEMKAQPGKRWETVITVVITAVVTGVIGFCLSKMGMK